MAISAGTGEAVFFNFDEAALDASVSFFIAALLEFAGLVSAGATLAADGFAATAADFAASAA
jgi:hypothetical protein